MFGANLNEIGSVFWDRHKDRNSAKITFLGSGNPNIDIPTKISKSYFCMIITVMKKICKSKSTMGCTHKQKIKKC